SQPRRCRQPSRPRLEYRIGAMAGPLILVGDGLFAGIAFEYFTYDSDYDVVAFTVEAEYLKRDTLCGLPIVPFEALQDHYDPAGHSVYAALTYTQVNRLRARLSQAAKAKGYKLA